MLDRLRRAGMTRCGRCRLTRNRRVMVSFAGTELRVHEGFLDAPDDVIAAIARFVEARSRAVRLEARRVLLGFPITTPAGPRRRERMHPDDAPIAQRLTQCHRDYNAAHFGGELTDIRVRVSRRMTTRLGHYSAATRSGDPPEIAISRRHLRRHGWEESLETLLHEMVHQWQDERGLPIDHGRAFRAKARAVGIPPFARRLVAA
jgi:hypothetical protein